MFAERHGAGVIRGLKFGAEIDFPRDRSSDTLWDQVAQHCDRWTGHKNEFVLLQTSNSSRWAKMNEKVAFWGKKYPQNWKNKEKSSIFKVE